MRHVLLLAIAWGGTACAPPSDSSPSVQASAPEDAAARFVGTWSLDSFQDRREGEVVYPFGEDAFGRIVYGDNGKMAVVLMRQGRESAQDPGFFAYSGGFTVNDEAGTVAHHIEACSAPDWIGTDRVRNFELLDGDRLALRPVEGTSELIWRRER